MYYEEYSLPFLVFCKSSSEFLISILFLFDAIMTSYHEQLYELILFPTKKYDQTEITLIHSEFHTHSLK